MTAHVVALRRYIVKGCAAEDLDAIEAGVEGLAQDRRFMLVHAEDGSFLSQRKVPGLAVLAPRLRGERLVITAPGAGTLDIPVRHTGTACAVSLFGRWFGEGIDQGEQAAAWCSARLGLACRLVRTPPWHDRDGWGDTPGKVGFADAHAVLLCAEASLDELNARIGAAGGDPVPMNRFRPNIVLGGWSEPHAEDLVRTMRIGETGLAHSVRAVRCAVPTVEQSTGRRDGPEPTRTLATYRKEPELRGGVSFGTKFAVTEPGTLRIGDPVTVLERLPEGCTPQPP